MRPFNINESALDGVNLIEAGAGAGKTYAIEAIYVRLLLEAKLSVENILAVTYTEAATASLRERISDRIRNTAQAFADGQSNDNFDKELLKRHRGDRKLVLKTLKKALVNFQQAAVFTIHGFCRKMLLDYAFESRSRFDAELIADQNWLIKEIGEDFWRKRIYAYPPKLVEFLIQKNDHPGKLAEKTAFAVSQPFKRVLSGIDDGFDAGQGFREAESIYHRLATLWEKSRRVLEDILLKHPGLKHNPYNKKNTPVWMKRMDLALASDNPFNIDIETLKKFGADKIFSCRNRKAEPPRHEIFELCLSLRKALEKIELSFKKDCFEFISQSLEERKKALNVRYFDDLLKNLRDSLRDASRGDRLTRHIRQKFQAALIDEFQDTDPLQYEIFKKIFADRKARLFFIGDPKQSVYNFRGADIFAYLKAREIADKQYTLNTNWRSDTDLTRAVNYVFKFRDRPFVFEKISYPEISGAEKNPARSLFINGESEAPLRLWHVDDNGKKIGKIKARKKIAEALAGEIALILNCGAEKKAFLSKQKDENLPGADREYIAPEHIAVLARSHHEAELIRLTLKKYSVPGVINAKESVYKSPELEEIEIIMSAVAEPRLDRGLKSALATDIWGFTARRIHELERDAEKWETLREKFRRYQRLWEKEGFFLMISALIREENIAAELLRFSDGERRLTNLLQIIEIIHEAENADKLGVSALIKQISETRRENRLPEESGIMLETDEKAVRILTIHAAKGLEFPIVFCPFIWGETRVGENEVFFHDESNDDEPVLDLGSPNLGENRKKAEKEVLSENLRLLYVAVTRAKHCCYLVWGNINRTRNSALNYIFHQGKVKDSREQRSDLEKLVASSEGTISLSSPPEPRFRYKPAAEERPEKPSCRKFTGELKLNRGFASYSSLSSSEFIPGDDADRDRTKERPLLIKDKTSEPSRQELDILNLPGGAKTGRCFHEIFEEADFKNDDSAALKRLTREKLTKYDLDLKWEETAFKAVSNILSFPLFKSARIDDDFTLSRLDVQNRVSEMEFQFPMAEIDHGGLLEAIARAESGASSKDLSDAVKTLSFHSVGGFLKGYIDLIFRRRERHYIIDWKTNRLGDKPEDYDRRNMKELMIKHGFVFQSRLYSVALHKMLRLRLPGYDFDKHFGGVFYVFVRGAGDRRQPGRGIYYDDLAGAKNLIESLEKYLAGEG